VGRRGGLIALAGGAVAALALVGARVGPWAPSARPAAAPPPAQAVLVGTTEGRVRQVDAQSRVIHVVPSAVRSSASTAVTVTRDTTITAGDAAASFGDLREGSVLRVAYEIRSGIFLARTIEIVRTGAARAPAAASDGAGTEPRPAAAPGREPSPPAAAAREQPPPAAGTDRPAAPRTTAPPPVAPGSTSSAVAGRTPGVGGPAGDAPPAPAAPAREAQTPAVRPDPAERQSPSSSPARGPQTPAARRDSAERQSPSSSPAARPPTSTPPAPRTPAPPQRRPDAQPAEPDPAAVIDWLLNQPRSIP